MYVIITNFVIMSLFIAVIVEQFQHVASMVDLDIMRGVRQRQDEIYSALRRVFEEADVNKDGNIFSSFFLFFFFVFCAAVVADWAHFEWGGGRINHHNCPPPVSGMNGEAPQARPELARPRRVAAVCSLFFCCGRKLFEMKIGRGLNAI